MNEISMKNWETIASKYLTKSI